MEQKDHIFCKVIPSNWYRVLNY